LGLVLLLFCNTGQQAGLTGTPVGGLISADAAWTAANSPYVIVSSVLVARGATLAIGPGVTVRFNPGLSLQVDGTLLARGNPGALIKFTSSHAATAPGDWGFILFTDSSGDARYDEAGNYLSGSILEHCIIEFAGAGRRYALGVDRAGPLVNHCTIRGTAGSGIQLMAGTARVTNNAISGNTASGDGGGVYINSTPLGGHIVLSANATTGNVAAGNGGGIYVDNLSGATTLGRNIITGNRATGNGGGIYVSTSYGSVTSLAGNAILWNAASGDGGGGYIAASFGGASHLSGNTVADNKATGNGGAFYIESSSSSVTLLDNTIAGNDSQAALPSAIHLQGNSTSTFTFTNNHLWRTPGQYLLYNGLPSTAPQLNLKDNWWGTGDEAELLALIYDGRDNPTLGMVDYRPWLTQPRTPPPQG
jgi:parallel beta-helix repeat protein